MTTASREHAYGELVARTDALARDFRAGDRAAYEELSRLLAGRLASVGKRITGDEQEGQDVAQEALVKGFSSIDGWDGRGSFAGWLYTIATRCAIDRRRQDRGEVALSADVADGDAASPGPVELSLADERRATVRRALAELTDHQRVTVVLRHFEGMSLAEIAALRGCAVGTVKATLFQAFAKLRDRLIGLGER